MESALDETLRRLSTISPPGGVEVFSYKRNRGVSITLAPGGNATVRQRGYEQREITVATGGLKRLLRAIFRTEFPRSRKVRLCYIDGTEPSDLKRKKL